jgi:hypothetical protein
MKNKKSIYLLGLGVAIIWGTIINRVFNAVAGTDDTALPNAAKITKEAYNDYTLPKDTTHLLLNYRDPFGLKKQQDTVRAVVKRTEKTPVMKPVFNWGFIKYSGYIRNPDSKKMIALLNINGKNVMLAEGETAGNVKLVKNMRDSVKVNFNSMNKFISMTPRTL